MGVESSGHEMEGTKERKGCPSKKDAGTKETDTAQVEK
jgi:hypothetical protein